MRKEKKSIIQFDLDYNYVNSFESTYQVEKQTGFSHSTIYRCAKFWSLGCDKEKWYQENKRRPVYQYKGYIWRFYSDFENRE